MRIGRKCKNADRGIAATAGVDSWKTFANRIHGTDEFEMLDLFRGMSRSLHHRFIVKQPTPGTLCPVCFCEPDCNNIWFITSSCSHAVCLDCLKQYTANQVRDAEQQGPLRCPVCPQQLRISDAIAAFSDDKDLIRAWDLKIRDQLLRALPAYRSCPNCTNNNNRGGGFVTPKCLSPHYRLCQMDAATRINNGIPIITATVLILYVFLARYIVKTPSRSLNVDIFFLLSLIFISFSKFRPEAQRRVARWARDAFCRPITVECPCCFSSFILPSESKHLDDEETKTWMNANMRRCPSCSVPITKNGGCNQMKCLHCHVNFCWACMKLRTKCRPYNCHYNAVNSATPIAGIEPRHDTTLSRIDYYLAREPSQITAVYIYTFISLFARDVQFVQYAIGFTMSAFTLISFSLTRDLLIICILTVHYLR